MVAAAGVTAHGETTSGEAAGGEEKDHEKKGEEEVFGVNFVVLVVMLFGLFFCWDFVGLIANCGRESNLS